MRRRRAARVRCNTAEGMIFFVVSTPRERFSCLCFSHWRSPSACRRSATPAVRSFARARGIYSRPSKDRWRQAPVALLGGYAIAIAFAATVALRVSPVALWPLLAGPALMLLLGGLDDVWHFRPATKLVAQMAIAAAIISLAPPIRITGLRGGGRTARLHAGSSGSPTPSTCSTTSTACRPASPGIAGIFYLVIAGAGGADAAGARGRRVRRRGAGVPDLQLPARVDLHGRQRQPLPRLVPRRRPRCSRRPS